MLHGTGKQKNDSTCLSGSKITFSFSCQVKSWTSHGIFIWPRFKIKKKRLQGATHQNQPRNMSHLLALVIFLSFSFSKGIWFPDMFRGKSPNLQASSSLLLKRFRRGVADSSAIPSQLGELEVMGGLQSDDVCLPGTSKIHWERDVFIHPIINWYFNWMLNLFFTWEMIGNNQTSMENSLFGVPGTGKNKGHTYSPPRCVFVHCFYSGQQMLSKRQDWVSMGLLGAFCIFIPFSLQFHSHHWLSLLLTKHFADAYKCAIVSSLPERDCF